MKKKKKSGQKIHYYHFVLLTLALAMVVPFQNCGNYKGGLVLDSPGGNSVISQCDTGFCGGYVDQIYWNGCEAHALGWAWSDFVSQQKTVMGSFSNGTVCSGGTSLPRPDVRLLYPSISSDYSGFDCKAISQANYPSADLSLTQATVLGANSKNYSLTLDAFAQNTVVPADCNVTGMGKNFANACSTSIANFGYLDGATFDGNCNLTVTGWGWSKQAQAGVKVIFSDGTSVVSDIPDVRSDVTNAFPCVTGKSGFNIVISNKRFPASSLSNNKVTITALVYGGSVVQPITPIKRDVGNCKY